LGEKTKNVVKQVGWVSYKEKNTERHATSHRLIGCPSQRGIKINSQGGGHQGQEGEHNFCTNVTSAPTTPNEWGGGGGKGLQLVHLGKGKSAEPPQKKKGEKKPQTQESGVSKQKRGEKNKAQLREQQQTPGPGGINR